MWKGQQESEVIQEDKIRNECIGDKVKVAHIEEKLVEASEDLTL